MKEFLKTSINSPWNFREIPTSSPPGCGPNLECGLARGGSRIRDPQNREARRLPMLRIRSTSLDLKKTRKVWVLGAGKAAAPMGRAVEKILGRYLSGGVLATKYGHGLPLKAAGRCGSGAPAPRCKQPGSRRARCCPWRKATSGRTISSSAFSREALPLCLFPPPKAITLQDKLAVHAASDRKTAPTFMN